MGLYREMDHAAFADLVAWWQGACPVWLAAEEYRVERRLFLDEIAYKLSAFGANDVTFLADYLYAPDSDQRCAALMALADPEHWNDEIAAALCVAFLSDEPDLKLAALIGSAHSWRFILDQSQVADLLHASHGLLAGWALVYLSRANPDDAVSLLRAGLQAANPHLREFACDEAGDRGFRSLTPLLAQLRHDPDPHVRQAAEINYAILADTEAGAYTK